MGISFSSEVGKKFSGCSAEIVLFDRFTDSECSDNMCTITFVPKPESDFILTSNRDEAPGRETFPPKIYNENGVRLLYPKDAVAGGTWIGISERNRAMSLMNGGFFPHKRKAEYKKSRGVVLKDLLIAKDLDAEMKSYDFFDIEPFTAIAVEWKDRLRLRTLVWDGKELHDAEEQIQPMIWSSSPLYPGEIKSKRELWFSEFLKEEKEISSQKIMRFHHLGGEGNAGTDLIMDRGFVKTKSITQIVKRGKEGEMKYEDLDTEKVFVSSFGD